MVTIEAEVLPTVLVQVEDAFYPPSSIQQKVDRWEMTFQVDRSLHRYYVWIGSTYTHHSQHVTASPGDHLYVMVTVMKPILTEKR